MLDDAPDSFTEVGETDEAGSEGRWPDRMSDTGAVMLVDRIGAETPGSWGE